MLLAFYILLHASVPFPFFLSLWFAQVPFLDPCLDLLFSYSSVLLLFCDVTVVVCAGTEHLILLESGRSLRTWSRGELFQSGHAAEHGLRV